MDFGYIVKTYPYTAAAFLLAAIAAGLTFIFSPMLAVIELTVLLVSVFLTIRWFLKKLARKRESVELLTSSMRVGEEEESRLDAFPFPVLLAGRDGDIIWYNTRFESLIPDFSSLKNGNVNDIFPLTEKLGANEDVSVLEIKGDKHAYTVYTSQLRDDLCAAYFVDDTILKEIRETYNMTRPVILLVNVDSLEQAEDVMPHEDYYAMNSDLDRMITKWFSEYDCVFRKVSDGRFFAITESRNLDSMMQTRFGVIDKVRTAHFGPDEADITLSIGVGHSLDFKESEDSAREALDMARGRGGDQVAVKNGDNYEFFGGLTSGKEKRGKVKSRVFAAALDEYIANASDVLVMGHAFSDFDCVGAAAGIVAIVRAKSKNVHIVIDKTRTMAASLVKMLESGSGAISFITPEKALELATPATLLVIVDTMRVKLVEAPKLLELGLKTVIIDHHRMAVDHIEGNTYELLEPYASSACEMVTELVQYSPAKPKLTPNQAQALLSGIMLDTKDYTLRVGVRTFDAASYLKSLKADTVAVRKLFAGSAEDNIQINNVVNGAKYFGRYAIAVADNNGPSARLICSKAADELLNIENVDASFVISSFGGAINISARSLGRVNVQLIMEKLGGGGHHSMAAVQLPDLTVEQAEEQLKEAIETYMDTANATLGGNQQ
ncbi:MAG: DHH family phosphoesterase [Clostridia bacterium]|nr:DHH family phosphoesterase [Clostridia bacterium]